MRPRGVATEETSKSHLVLRIPLTTTIGRKSFNTVDAHNIVWSTKGELAVAKFGAAIGPQTLDRITQQLANDTDTYLILVAKNVVSRFLGHRARILSVHLANKSSQFERLAPPYYAELGLAPALWILVNEEFAPTDLREFRLTSSGRPLIDVLQECRTATMLVESKKSDQGSLSRTS